MKPTNDPSVWVLSDGTPVNTKDLARQIVEEMKSNVLPS